MIQDLNKNKIMMGRDTRFNEISILKNMHYYRKVRLATSNMLEVEFDISKPIYSQKNVSNIYAFEMVKDENLQQPQLWMKPQMINVIKN